MVILHFPLETEENHENISWQLVIRPSFETRTSRIRAYRFIDTRTGKYSDVRPNNTSIFINIIMSRICMFFCIVSFSVAIT